MPPRGSSKLSPYKDELLALQQEGRSLSYMAKHLAQTYGLAAACSTISDFLKQQESVPAQQTAGTQPESSPPPLPVAQERYLDQVEVFAEIQASIKVVVDELANLRAVSQVTGEDQAALAGRVHALCAQVEQMRGAASESGGRETAMLDSLSRISRFVENRGEKPANPGIPPALLRKIWARALWFTSFFWACVFGAGVYFWSS